MDACSLSLRRIPAALTGSTATKIYLSRSRGASAVRARAAVLTLGASALLFSPAARAATDTWRGTTSANFSTLNGFDAVPQNGDTLVFGPAGASGTSLNNDITGLSVGGGGTDGIDFLLTASPFTIAGNAITLASSAGGIGINDLALMAETISAPLTLASAQTINVGPTDGTLTLSGAISGAYTITKTGAGLLGLSAANTFSGMTITGGTVAIGTDGSLGSTTGTVTLDGGTLRTAFNGATVATLSAGRSFLLGDAGAGTGGSIDTGATNTTYAGVLANNGGTNSFTKTGANILTLGGTNTYTGATIINAGTLVLNSTGSINSASTLVMGGSSTVLGVVADGNMSTFELQGISGTARTQTFAGLTLKAGISQILSEAVSTSATTIALGAIDHTTNPGGILAFSQLGYGGANTGLITTTTGNDATGILGGWAVINNTNPNASTAQVPTDYAANDGTGNIVAYTGYTAQAAGAIASSTTSNARVTAAGGVALTVGAGTTDLNTLSNAGTATGTTTVTIATGGVLRLGASGGLLTASGAGGFNITGGGTLTAGGSAVANNPGTIYLIGGSGGFTLGTTIADNGTGAVTVVGSQYNGNNFAINGNNTYSGGTYLNLGRWQVNTNTGFGTGAVNVSNDAQAYLNFGGTMTNNFNIIGSSAGNNDTNSAIRFQGGQTLSGTITLLGDSQLQASSGTDTLSGQITGAYNLTLTQNNGGVNWVLSNPNNNWGGNLTINGTKVSLGASNVLPDGAAAGNVILTNNGNSILELNGYSDTINGLVSSGAVGVGTVQSTAAGASVLTVGGNNQSTAFNGLVTDGGAGMTLGITKTGTGTLVFGDTANTYLGGTTINGGTLRLSAASGAKYSSIGAITGALTVNTGGTLNLNGYSQTVGSLAGTGGVINSNVTGTPTLTVGTAGGTASTVFAGSIQNGAATSIGLTVQGSTLDLTGVNTYTGATNVTGGTLQLGTGGSIAGTSGIALSGTGGLMLGDAGGPVSATLANLTTTASNIVAGGATANSTLTLNDAGSATFANAFGGGGTNQNNLNLVIAGTGTTPTTILSGSSSYTGTTTVNSGSTLNLSGSLGNTAVTVNSGATITGANINSQVIGGNLTVAGGATLTLSNSASFFSVGGNVTLGGTGAYAANHSTVNFTLGGNSAAEALNVNGNLTLGTGGVYVDIINPTQTGTYNLANYSGSPTGFSLSSTTANITTQSVGRDNESLSSGGGSLTLTITGAATPATAYFNGYVSSVWNDLSNATRVNFSSNLAGTTDAGNVPGATSDVILNATNAPTNRGTATLSETLGANTIINSLSVNNVGTTTLAADGSTLTIEAAAGMNAAGVGIVIAANANPFTINPPLILGGDQSWTNNSANLFTVGGTVTGVSSVANTLTLANTGAGGTTINGVIADGAGGTLALVVANTGAGVTTLTGANTYSGGTTLTSGTLNAAGTGALGAGFVTVDPTQNTAPTGTAADNATLNSTGSIASTAAVTVNSRTDDGAFGVGTLNFNGATPSIGSLAGTGNGQVVLNNASGTTLTVGNNNTNTTFSGVISNGAGTGSLVKAGTGAQDLTGANTYTGTTAVQAGTLQIGAGGSLVATSAVTLGNGTGSGLLALGDGNGAVNQTLASLATSGTGTANAVVGGATAVSTLTLNNASALTVGSIFGGAGSNQNNLALQYTGAGTVTLAGDNTYTGGTTVAAGSTVVANTNAGLGANVAASTVTINGGGVVDINSTTSANYNYTFAGSGKVLFNFPGGGSDSQVPNTAFNGFTGTIEVANPGGTNNKLVVQGLTGSSGAFVQIDSGGQLFVGSGTQTFAGISVIGTGNGENRGAIRLNAGTLGGNISLLGNTTVGNEGGTLTGNISTGVAGVSTLTMGTGNSQGTATLNGVLSDGIGQLALTQAYGTTTLTGANTYTGATTVTRGVLSLTTGSINSSNSVSIASTGTLTLANSAALSDSAILTMVAGATLNLNAPSGTTEIIAGLVLDGVTEMSGMYTAAQLMVMDSAINFGSLNGETLTIGAVPEPSSFWVAICGLGLLGYSLRRRISGRLGA
jgi:fibronectin-binding autotransporter adhesin